MGVEIKLDYGAIAGLEKSAERAAKMTIDAVKADVVTAQVMPNGWRKNSKKKATALSSYEIKKTGRPPHHAELGVRSFCN